MRAALFVYRLVCLVIAMAMIARAAMADFSVPWWNSMMAGSVLGLFLLTLDGEYRR